MSVCTASFPFFAVVQSFQSLYCRKESVLPFWSMRSDVTSVKQRNDTCEKSCGTVMHSWDWSVKSANNQYQHCLFPRLRHYCAAPLSRLNVTAFRQNCLTRRVPPCCRDGCGLTATEGCHVSLYEAFSALMLEGGEGTAALSNAHSENEICVLVSNNRRQPRPESQKNNTCHRCFQLNPPGDCSRWKAYWCSTLQKVSFLHSGSLSSDLYVSTSHVCEAEVVNKISFTAAPI